MLKIFNTLGRELQEFKPIKDGKVSFYQCGPTVYWTQHIGNMRAMVMADLIRCSFEYLGYDVEFVRNYTDFGHLTSDGDEGEDKMEKGAKRENTTPEIIANKYIQEFEKDTDLLNIKRPNIEARATHYLEEMIKMVSDLLEKEFAYSTPAAIYFDISKFPEYTKLSGQKLEMNKEGAGFGDVSDQNKKNPQDFALWFFKTGAHKNALQFWPSPFKSSEVENGEGFPGWHIECSAMVRKTLGNTIDVHMGGVEHIPVHHTNEIAQSESANGVHYVNYWLHNEHVDVDGTKMSKSLGNVYNLSNIIEKGFDPMDLRYFFLQAHYRSKQNFTFEGLEAAKTARERLVKALVSLVSSISEDVNIEFKKKFASALEEDFNLPKALAIVWEILKSDISDSEKLATILDFDKVLGLRLSEKIEILKQIQDDVEGKENSDEVKQLIEERKKAREEKNWTKADEIRDRLKNEFGVEVMDR